MTHDEIMAQSPIKVGYYYRFEYPDLFTTLSEYSNRRNHIVQVIRPCTEKEADILWDDPEGNGTVVDRMFRIKAADGWEGSAWESELA